VSFAVTTENLVDVRGLTKTFRVRTGPFSRQVRLTAVDDVTFSIKRGEVLGLVGESGCGKTTCGKMVIRLLDPTKGSIHFAGHNISNLKQKEMMRFRRMMTIIYQDPFGSLDPRMRIGATIAEPMVVHRLLPKNDREDRVVELVKRVGLSPDQMGRYPHEFSGGQRQRIGIARALATSPQFLVADEPVSALDVSIQAQIINLLQDLQEEFALTILFIAHDLSVIRHICDRVAVMYLGRIVEVASRDEIFGSPKHPYTQALLSSIPIPSPGAKARRIILSGDVPSPITPPPGCRFHPRCPEAIPRCAIAQPHLTDVAEEHYVACHLRNQRTSSKSEPTL
jgi:oligopeptide/dipeptide ABC transporter ATP-binding protein